jgi:diguanylate cyclase (GGDEF)-like protein
VLVDAAMSERVVLSAAGQVPDPPGTDDDARIDRAYAVLNEQPALALELARPARESGEPRLAGRACALEARVAIRRGDLERALAVLLEGEPLVARCDAPDLQAEVAIASARLTFYSGGYRDALERIEEAIAIADANGLQRARVDARSHLTLVLGSMGLPECLHVARELVALARELGLPYDEAAARNDVAYCLYTAGDVEEAAREVEPAIELAASLGDAGRYALAYSLGTRADIRLSGGDARGALADVDEVLRLLEDGDEPDPYLHGVTHEVRMRCLVALGRMVDAVQAGYRGLIVTGSAVPFVRGLLLRGLADVLRAAGRPDEAYDALAEGYGLERVVLEQQATRQLALQRAALETAAARRETAALTARNAELHALVEELHDTKAELERRMRQLERLRDRFREQAHQDWLTGLRNRRWLARELPRLVATARRSGEQMALAIFDIDHFKTVNDRFGHDVGDRVLRTFASVLVAGLRESDVVVRTGGEEFAVIMPATTREEAVNAAERVRDALRDSSWPVPDDDLALTVSAGIVTLDERETVRELSALADDRLYAAKAAGRDRIAA